MTEKLTETSVIQHPQRSMFSVAIDKCTVLDFREVNLVDLQPQGEVKEY